MFLDLVVEVDGGDFIGCVECGVIGCEEGDGGVFVGYVIVGDFEVVGCEFGVGEIGGGVVLYDDGVVVFGVGEEGG